MLGFVRVTRQLYMGKQPKIQLENRYCGFSVLNWLTNTINGAPCQTFGNSLVPRLPDFFRLREGKGGSRRICHMNDVMEQRRQRTHLQETCANAKSPGN